MLLAIAITVVVACSRFVILRRELWTASCCHRSLECVMLSRPGAIHWSHYIYIIKCVTCILKIAYMGGGGRCRLNVIHSSIVLLIKAML